LKKNTEKFPLRTQTLTLHTHRLNELAIVNEEESLIIGKLHYGFELENRPQPNLYLEKTSAATRYNCYDVREITHCKHLYKKKHYVPLTVGDVRWERTFVTLTDIVIN
jgi:hypothetical protein